MSRIYGTAPGLVVGEAVAEGEGLAAASLTGCLALAVVAVLAIVAALVLIGLILHSVRSTTGRQEASPPTSQVQSKVEAAPIREGAAENSNTQIVNQPRGGVDEGELQARRLRALSSGNISEYNHLVEQHLRLYRQYHVDPCTSGFFPQGCSQAAENEEQNPPPAPVPPVSTTGNPPPPKGPWDDNGEERKASNYSDSTRGTSVPNRDIDPTRSEFEKTLAEDGWTRIRHDDQVTIWEKDGASYRIRNFSKSGPPTAEYFKAGSETVDLKIRFKVP